MRIERTNVSEALDVTSPQIGGEGEGLAPTPTLPSPSAVTSGFAGDPAADLAALMVQAGQQQRRAADALRRSEEAMIDRHEREQVAAMERKAGDIRLQGWVEGIASAAQGGAQLGAAELMCEAAAAPFPKARALEAASGRWQAAGKIGEGLAKLGATELALAGGREDTDAARSGQAAERAKRANEDARTAEREAADWVRSALQFCREYTKARDEAQRAALHRV